MDTFDLLGAGGAVGALIGLIPLLYGIFHARMQFGILSMIGCVLAGIAGLGAGAGLSIALALAVALLTTYLMYREDQRRV